MGPLSVPAFGFGEQLGPEGGASSLSVFILHWYEGSPGLGLNRPFRPQGGITLSARNQKGPTGPVTSPAQAAALH